MGETLLRDPPVAGLSKIGECVESGLWLETDGKREPLAPVGWVHPLSGSLRAAKRTREIEGRQGCQGFGPATS